jgi:hypothetical protein
MKAFLQAYGAALAVAAFNIAPAHAGDIVGGSVLLKPAQQAQLETWLGRSDVHLTNIYTLQQGHSAADFHAAADGKGSTFSLLQVTNGTDHWLVGGYNPQSWDSSGSWHETPLDSERTGFVFNLSTSMVYHQVPSSYILPSQGAKQTWNSPAVGPAFGQGGDLWVNGDMQTAYSWLFTYGDPALQGTSLIDGSMPAPLPNLVRVEGLEVLAISTAPEPSTVAMLGTGLAVTAWAARRRQRRARLI